MTDTLAVNQVAPIERVPQGWQILPLRRLFRISGGATPKSDVAEYWDGEIDWVTPADLGKTPSLEVHNSARTLTRAGLDSCAAELLPPRSIIVSVRAPIGAIGIAKVPMATNQGCKGLVGQSAEPRFMAYQLSVSQESLEAIGRGTTFTELSATDLGSFQVAVPPLDLQRTIADFLDRETAKIDALIDKQEKLIATLREDRAATITHAITRGLSSGAEFVESGIAAVGEYPNGWTLGRLKLWISRIESGTSVNAADAPASLEELGVLKTSCVYTGNFDAAENKTIFPEESDRVSCPLRPGTLIVSRMNTPELVGSAGYVDDAPANLYLPDRLWQVSFRDALAEWFAYWSKTSAYRGQLKSVCVGTSSSMQNISQGDYGSLLLAVPPVEEQRKIVKFLDSRCANIESLVEKSTQMIAGLREYRSALITNAVTGKIDVREAV